MASPSDCEKVVIEKLISVFSKALNCQPNLNGENVTLDMSNGEVSVIEKVLRILLAQNETLFTSNGNEILFGNQDLTSTKDQNSIDADVVVLYSESGVSSYTGNVGNGGLVMAADNSSSLADSSESTGVSKLHKLEIIKVFVLIFVISIILLTTCRMVFQLFIRFRPEKPPLA